ncbi:Uncharacterised protein [Niallia circulans]|nr:hypothetical protein [Niallia circulans]SPT85788.1 Uncharacterised protein [Niallia circulans]
MGTYHAEVYALLPQAELVALCEYNDKRRAEAKEIKYIKRIYK